jgi:riboflavin kinase/FMN adenylyltransferase
MILIMGLEQLRERFEHVILTIGNFDGLHIGHQKIFRAVGERSKATGGTAMAMTELLRRRGRKYGFLVKVVRSAKLFGGVVSSSRVRDLLSRGNVNKVSWLLGRPYMIKGRVVSGTGRGAKVLQVPTANLDTNYEIVPKEGVYVVKVGYRGRLLEGVANIGRNPTFGNSCLCYEVHILNFSEPLLGEEINVHFIDRLRDERRYPDVTALKEHIMQDIAQARDILVKGNYPKAQ